MNNKGFVKIITVLFLVISIYQLSFTFFTNRVENKAEEKAARLFPDDQKAAEEFEKSYLDSLGSEEIYPLGFTSFTYDECKERELNLGLDLQGGMNVTVEVETSELVETMAGGTRDQAFLTAMKEANEAYLGDVNFVDLLEEKYKAISPNGRLASIFYRKGLEEDLPNGLQSTNTEIYDYLKAESESAVGRAFEIISARIDGFGVAQPNIQRLENGRILVELPGVDDPDRVKDLIVKSAKLEFWREYDRNEAAKFLDGANKLLGGQQVDSNDAEAESDTPDSTKVDEDEVGSLFGDKTQADDSTEVDSTELAQKKIMDENPIFAILRLNVQEDQWGLGPIGFINEKDMAKLEEYMNNPKVRALMPKNLRIKYGFKPSQYYENNTEIYDVYALKTDPNGTPALSGDVITNAQPTRKENMQLAVSMVMNQEGTKVWKRVTADASSKAPKEFVAVVLDNKVYSAPTVQNEIGNGSSEISGNFDIQEANDLSNILKAGKLPARARITGENTVGPTLGADAINAGLLSLAVGFILVILFMMAYYGRAGIYAVLALLANVIFILGVLAGMGAALTLPGMAGLVLTIGMAVDANVLVFERVREELQGGKSFKMAVRDGYNGAYSSILDANITTLIAGIILMLLGKGPVLGFAVILVIGIFSSLFTSIFLTRLLIERDITNEKETSFYSGWSERLSVKLNALSMNIVGKRKMFYIISGIVITAGIVSLFTKGLSTGVDFKGGRSYVVQVDNASAADIRSALNTSIEANNEVKTYGADNQFKITTSYMMDSKDTTADDKVQDAVISSLSKLGVDKDNVLSTYKVGPTIAKDTKNKSTWAIALAIIGMFLYILIRFRNVGFGMGATIALFHDVLIVLSLYSIFWNILPFSLDIDTAFVAAILTVVGYSINDTVVVFDRVREYLAHHKYEKDKISVINAAVNQTLSRTLITSLTTLLVIVILFTAGGEGLKGFTFALLLGVSVGTYSSICIATPIVVDYMKKFSKK